MYLEGFYKEENIRARDYAIEFTARPPARNTARVPLLEFPDLAKSFEAFRLDVAAGVIHHGEVVGVPHVPHLPAVDVRGVLRHLHSCGGRVAVEHVEAGQVVGPGQRRAGDARLVEDLGTTQTPYFCPHGRPIVSRIAMSDVRRGLKRNW